MNIKQLISTLIQLLINPLFDWIIGVMEDFVKTTSTPFDDRIVQIIKDLKVEIIDFFLNKLEIR